MHPKTNRKLDGVAIRTDLTGRYCGDNCPLLIYINGTCCAMEAAKAKAGLLRSRYDKTVWRYRRCPTCLRRERKFAAIVFGNGD